MWWAKKDGDNDPASSTPHSRKSNHGGLVPGSGKKKNNIMNRRRHLMGRASVNDAGGGSGGSTKENDQHLMHVAETMSGIEVSFSDEVRTQSSPDQRLRQLQKQQQQLTVGQLQLKTVDGMISLSEQIARRRKIYRAQFSLLLGGGPTGSSGGNSDESSNARADISSSNAKSSAGGASAVAAIDFKVGKHRVPLLGKKTIMSFDDALFLLRSHEVRDEFNCVREELAKLDSEIAALEKDRNKLEHRALNVADDEDDADGVNSKRKRDAARRRWDFNTVLSSQTENLSQQERSALQEKRGCSLTVSLQNQQARETFLARCGSIASVIRAEQQRAKNTHRKSGGSVPGPSSEPGVVTLCPKTCRDGGAAATIQHVSLLKGGGTAESAFFISRDKGKSYYWGHLPDRLFRRMKNSGLDPKHHATDLIYLSTGPMGCYYAQFRSGECWWGSIVEDTEFDAICKDREWDIHRVVFGAGTTITDVYGHKRATTSWIILGRDGRVAWKNLPARLHNKLEGRLASEPAPIEVALGSGGSYFVRFLDGTTDYCLPAKMSKVCRSLERQGKTITSMSMHPELHGDFVIRHC